MVSSTIGRSTLFEYSVIEPVRRRMLNDQDSGLFLHDDETTDEETIADLRDRCETHRTMGGPPLTRRA